MRSFREEDKIDVSDTAVQIATWIACLCVCLFNSAMPHLNMVGIFLILAGFLITIIVV